MSVQTVTHVGTAIYIYTPEPPHAHTFFDLPSSSESTLNVEGSIIYQENLVSKKIQFSSYSLWGE